MRFYGYEEYRTAPAVKIYKAGIDDEGFPGKVTVATQPADGPDIYKKFKSQLVFVNDQRNKIGHYGAFCAVPPVEAYVYAVEEAIRNGLDAIRDNNTGHGEKKEVIDANRAEALKRFTLD